MRCLTEAELGFRGDHRGVDGRQIIKIWQFNRRGH